MEKIELRVEKVGGAGVDRQWSAVFGVAGGTVGRGGQNKLVLPDVDAGVARVHAMVRLESDAAYIANLCERRSIHVAGKELLSGQETQLRLDDEVQIGPYSLRAVAPGASANAPGARIAPSPVPVAQPAAGFPPADATPQVAAANPWADTAAFPKTENFSVLPTDDALAAMATSALPSDQVTGPGGAAVSSLGVLRGDAAAQAHDPANPFAMLGRVEAGAPPAGFPQPPVAAPAVWAPQAVPETAQGQPAAPASTASLAGFDLPVAAPLPAAAAPSPSALPNVFDGVMPKPQPAAPAVSRPLIIPADFDPFARDPKKETENHDPWSGGLPEQSLAAVANIPGDDLLRSLPLKGRFDHSMDNPAHSGLPKALDPKTEIDPMRLFESSEVSATLTNAGSAEAARGQELAQVFSLPRGAAAPGDAAALASAAAQPPSAPAQPARAPEMQNLGLQATQGLDLDMFGDGGVLDGGPAPGLAGPSFGAQPSATKPAGQPSVPGAWGAAPHGPAPAFAPAAGAVPAAVSLPREPVDLNLGEPRQAGPFRAAAPASMPAPTSAPAAASPGNADAQALINAFLEGAGLAPGRVEAVMTPEFMRNFGEAFRVAVQGTIDLLAARSEIKREFRADVTVIAPRANNPLKFLPNADGVIMQMVGQNFPGFMKPVPSMKEAYFDLQVHQLALMAGIRAAYSEALTRFDPAELEKRCEASGGLLSKISSTAKKAAVWDDYKQSYNAIRRHAEDDLVAFSGEAFVKAYEAAAEAARSHS